ncbi:ArsR/SmtB family transcription factor [Kribbella sp. CA-293567]|uniref:ArsR/SmtB family transcription factor n=1 Tax=Kribbella sp. CA-293567 TaxID=3002436 RepID=UPI0022DD603A|nr:metalloregulator ArsR/SmtB family transcription factor [Kribbella sp. CA-293567]WBQ05126.1 metalloregulator ArsR/SmtB family transcription factor [Kribbella sp. CA-293567]
MSKQDLPVGRGGGCCAPISVSPLDEAAAVEGAAVLKALSDPIRLRLMSIIASADDEVCVCDITPYFAVSGPTISHHLRVLREAGLVDCERRGTWVYYWPLPDRMQWISALLAAPDASALTR